METAVQVEEVWGHKGVEYVDDRECSGDRIDRVQDLQGVPESQDWYRGRPNVRGHWREQTSACHIHNN